MRGLGGGAIGQGVGASGRPVRNTAGWAQINVKAPGIWSTGVGCGIDDPRDEDIQNDIGRLRNAACAAYAIARPGGPVFIGAEARRMSTRYTSGSAVNNHFNVAFGFEF
jgi:hypothetical protein